MNVAQLESIGDLLSAFGINTVDELIAAYLGGCFAGDQEDQRYTFLLGAMHYAWKEALLTPPNQ